MNESFDLIKVWVNDKHLLTYSTAFIAEGMSRATFRATVDGMIASESGLANEAATAKLLVADPEPAKR